jgi:uncharacterized membrane protein YgcG
MIEYALVPDAGAEEEIGDVLEADLGLVDQVLAGPVAVEPAGDGDLGVVAVLEGSARPSALSKVIVTSAMPWARGRSPRRSRPSSTAAQVLRALLAHAPADRVDDVRLAAAVRPDDADDVVVEVDHRAVDERLEAGDLELLDSSGSSSVQANDSVSKSMADRFEKVSGIKTDAGSSSGSSGSSDAGGSSGSSGSGSSGSGSSGSGTPA